MKYKINKQLIMEATYSKTPTKMGLAKKRVLDMHVAKAQGKPVVHPNTGSIEYNYNTRARKKLGLEESKALLGLGVGAGAATLYGGKKVLDKTIDTLKNHKTAVDDAMEQLKD